MNEIREELVRFIRLKYAEQSVPLPVRCLARESPVRRARHFHDASRHSVSTREYQSDQQSFNVAHASETAQQEYELTDKNGNSEEKEFHS